VKRVHLAVALVLVASQSGCLFKARPDSYFTLAPSGEPPVRSAGSLTVGLGPVTLPGYLSRPSLMTRIDGTQVRFAEGERWADPLERQFVNTLREDLSRALGGARVIDYPWYPSVAMDVTVVVTVLAFEVDTTGAATLTADWTVRNLRSRGAGYEGQSAILEPAAVASGKAKSDAAVAALSRALARFSRELAEAIVTNTPSR
jgi:uncharacterized lipoprotein YmbA